MSRKTTMIAAIREAIDEEMLRDENVIVLGEDIGPLGGPFGSCIGLLEKYGSDAVRYWAASPRPSASGASRASAWAPPCAASAPSSS